MAQSIRENVEIFADVLAEIYKIYDKRFSLIRFMVLRLLINDCGRIGLIIAEKGRILGKYTIYIDSESSRVANGIEKGTAVYYRISPKGIMNIIQFRSKYLNSAYRLIKLLSSINTVLPWKEKASYNEALRGKKVVLRPSIESDLIYLMQWYNDYELNKLAGWNNSRVSEANLRFNYSKGYGYDPLNLMIDNEEGKPIGTIQLYDFNNFDKDCKLGIRIGDKDYWGKGYGEDSVRTILEYAFVKLNMNRVSLRVYEYNERAAKCYVKCGFACEGRSRKSAFIDGKYYDEILMGILKSEFIGINYFK